MKPPQLCVVQRFTLHTHNYSHKELLWAALLDFIQGNQLISSGHSAVDQSFFLETKAAEMKIIIFVTMSTKNLHQKRLYSPESKIWLDGADVCFNCCSGFHLIVALSNWSC